MPGTYQKLWLNGELLPVEKAAIHPFDRGFLLGDGLFETLRVYGTSPFALERHLERLAGSLKRFRITIPEGADALADAVRQTIETNQAIDCALRITVTRGHCDGPLGLVDSTNPTRMIYLRPLTEMDSSIYEKGVDVHLSTCAFSRPQSLAGHKTLGYLEHLAARQEATDNGAFEAIHLTPGGDIVEGAASNFFCVHKGRVLTPPLQTGALPGITRDICIRLLRGSSIPVFEENINLSMLAELDEAWLTNSLIEATPIRKIDDLILGKDKPRPVFCLLQKKYRELVTAK